MPETSKKIAEQIGADDLSFESTKTFGETKAGTKVGEAVPLFQRIDAEKKLAELEENSVSRKRKRLKLHRIKIISSLKNLKNLIFVSVRYLNAKKCQSHQNFLDLLCKSEVKQDKFFPV